METTYTDAQLRRLLLETLEKTPRLRRKALLERCVAQLDFSQTQLSDRTAGSPVIRCKSRLGALLSELIRSGDIAESESGYLSVLQAADAVAQRERAAVFLLGELRQGAALPRRELFARADRAFAPATKEQSAALHALLGESLRALERTRQIVESPGGYCLPQGPYPNSELGYWLQAAENGADAQECFLQAVHAKGGEWLEDYAVHLLADYFRRCGKTVTAARVTGGSNDGGLDGVIETTDPMGFREKMLLQMKNRYSPISPKDVREFYGAVCIARGSRGIFVTISTFHPEAQRLLEQVDNLIGVDGAKLFAIAAYCGMGVRSAPAGARLDPALFLEKSL